MPDHRGAVWTFTVGFVKYLNGSVVVVERRPVCLDLATWKPGAGRRRTPVRPRLDELVCLRESGSDRIGALDFQDSSTDYVARESDDASLEDVLEAARYVDRSLTLPPALDTALRHRTAIGGARPKALFAERERRWVAKFPSGSDAFPVVRAEFMLMRLASLAGLDVAPVQLVRVRGEQVLLVERFDRVRVDGGWTRRAMVSALTVLGLDEMEARYASYEAFAEVVRARFNSPTERLRELFSRSQLITSPGDLAAALLDALARLQAELRGPQNPVRSLWDRQGTSDRYRPIDEDGLSDYVRLYLQRTLGAFGVFANREVEVGRVPGAPIGRRTDILINAVRGRADGGTYDALTAVIEMKGCWNEGLMTSLPNQLFSDYMVTLQAPIGIYLVGWFPGDKSDDSDRRKRRGTATAKEDVQRGLDIQAGALPPGFEVSPFLLECRLP